MFILHIMSLLPCLPWPVSSFLSAHTMSTQCWCGTLIAIDCVLDQLQEEKVVDIAGVIIHLRTQRMKMVQSLVSEWSYIIT